MCQHLGILKNLSRQDEKEANLVFFFFLLQTPKVAKKKPQNYLSNRKHNENISRQMYFMKRFAGVFSGTKRKREMSQDTQNRFVKSVR